MFSVKNDINFIIKIKHLRDFNNFNNQKSGSF